MWMFCSFSLVQSSFEGQDTSPSRYHQRANMVQVNLLAYITAVPIWYLLTTNSVDLHEESS